MRKNTQHQPTPRPKTNRKGLRMWGWILSVFLLFGAAAAVLLTQMKPGQETIQPLATEINVAEAKQRFDDGTYLLDVRTPEEWNEMHVAGAVLIPLDELPNRLSEVPKDRPVMVICRSGNRSQTGRDILKNAGYSQVTSVAGGIRQWISADYPTITGP